MKLNFKSRPALESLQTPTTTSIPQLRTAEIAAQYRAARVGGDFYDFMLAGQSKLVMLMMDIAGKRATALHLAAVAQEMFRRRGEELFSAEDCEDSAAVTSLLLEINRAIITAAGGVCCAPAFLACYDEEIGVLTYINAGHTPAVMKDQHGTLLLEANGLPLGLFSHATHDAQYCALSPGAVVALVSKGLVEIKNSRQEFGIAGVQKMIESREFTAASELCKTLHDTVTSHEKQPSFFGPSLQFAGIGIQEPNDVTTLVLMRKAAGVSARA